jgi:hypothetical protein
LIVGAWAWLFPALREVDELEKESCGSNAKQN